METWPIKGRYTAKRDYESYGHGRDEHYWAVWDKKEQSFVEKHGRFYISWGIDTKPSARLLKLIDGLNAHEEALKFVMSGAIY